MMVADHRNHPGRVMITDHPDTFTRYSNPPQVRVGRVIVSPISLGYATCLSITPQVVVRTCIARTRTV